MLRTAGWTYLNRNARRCAGTSAGYALTTPSSLPQHPDEHRPEHPVLLAVDQELGQGATLRVAQDRPASSPLVSAVVPVRAPGCRRPPRCVGERPLDWPAAGSRTPSSRRGCYFPVPSSRRDATTTDSNDRHAHDDGKKGMSDPGRIIRGRRLVHHDGFARARVLGDRIVHQARFNPWRCRIAWVGG